MSRFSLANLIWLPTSNPGPTATRMRWSTCRQAVGELRGKDREKLRIMCPLLDADGACGVYPVRPISCRSYASFDRAACERDWKSPEDGVEVMYSTTLREMGKELTPQIQEAQSRVGILPGGYELIKALHGAFATPDFERRCMAGENVLAKAAL